VLAHLCIAVKIPVDPSCLWKTQVPFKVYTTSENMVGNPDIKDSRGETFRGFIVAMHVDPRDVLGAGPPHAQFEFQAKVTGKSQVTVTAPLLSHHDMGHDDHLVEAMTRPNNLEEEIFLEALKNQRVAFEKSKAQNTMHYVLDFGPNVHLCAEYLEQHRGRNFGDMNMEALPLCVPFDGLGTFQTHVLDRNGDPYGVDQGGPFLCEGRYRYFCGVLYWRIADVNQDTRKTRVAAVARDTQAATKMLERMNIRPGNP
jgi:hypothetical protein